MSVEDSMKFQGSLTPELVRSDSWSEYREYWSQAERLSLLTEHPLHLDIELTSHCNLKCDMCWQSGHLDTTHGYMTDDLFKRIIDDGVELGLRAIKLQIRGESMLHPRIHKLSQYAKDAGIFDIQLTTNGTLFTKDGKLENMLSCGLSKLIFSIDPSHDESAEEIYGAKAPDVKAIFAKAVEKKRALGGDTPALRVQTITLPGQDKETRLSEIQSEYPDADEFIVNHIYNSKADEDALVGLSTQYDLFPCSYLWTRLAIYWDGQTTMCCRDYNCTMKLGDVNQDSVRDIWLGQKMMNIRKMHLSDRRKSINVCKNCEVCSQPKSGGSSEGLHVISSMPSS